MMHINRAREGLPDTNRLHTKGFLRHDKEVQNGIFPENPVAIVAGFSPANKPVTLRCPLCDTQLVDSTAESPFYTSDVADGRAGGQLGARATS